MPSNPAALEALRKLSAQPYKPTFDSSSQDPTVGRYLAQQDIKDGVEDQLVNATKARGYAASDNPRQVPAYEGDIRGLSQLLGSTEDDIQSSPITTGIKQATDYGDQDRNAILAGFRGGENQNHQYLNPVQQANQYKMEQERNKLQQPLDVAKINAQGGVEAEKVRAQGGLDVANAKGSQIEAAMNTAFATGKPIQSFNPSTGATSFQRPSTTPAVNASLLRDITTTRNNLQAKGPRASFLGMQYGGDTPEKVAYDNAVAMALSQHPAGHDLKDLATFVADNQDLLNLPADQVLAHPKVQQNFDLSSMTPEERNQLEDLLYIVRGLPAGQ